MNETNQCNNETVTQMADVTENKFRPTAVVEVDNNIWELVAEKDMVKKI